MGVVGINQGTGCLPDFRMGKYHVDFCTDKKDVHAKIQPEHTNRQGSQASVQIGKTSQMVNIEGKKVRKSKPASGGQKGAGKLGKEF